MIRVTKDGDLEVDVHLAPRARKVGLGPIHAGRIKIQVSAPPVDGKANRAVCELVAETLGVPKSQVSILRGETSRQKTLRLQIGDVRRADVLRKQLAELCVPEPGL